MSVKIKMRLHRIHSLILYVYSQLLCIIKPLKLKELADDSFKFDENGRKFSEGLKSPWEKGEIACDEQFLPFPQCFQETSEDT